MVYRGQRERINTGVDLSDSHFISQHRVSVEFVTMQQEYTALRTCHGNSSFLFSPRLVVPALMGRRNVLNSSVSHIFTCSASTPFWRSLSLSCELAHLWKEGYTASWSRLDKSGDKGLEIGRVDWKIRDLRLEDRSAPDVFYIVILLPRLERVDVDGVPAVVGK